MFFIFHNPNLRGLHVHHQSLRNSDLRGLRDPNLRGLHVYHQSLRDPNLRSRHGLRDPIRGRRLPIELMAKFFQKYEFFENKLPNPPRPLYPPQPDRPP